MQDRLEKRLLQNFALQREFTYQFFQFTSEDDRRTILRLVKILSGHFTASKTNAPSVSMTGSAS